MRTWERARAACLCGLCGRILAKGDAVLVFSIARGTRPPIRRIRCDRCEGPAPPDLPALVELVAPRPSSTLARLRPILPLGTPLADWRARQAGREPGEDG